MRKNQKEQIKRIIALLKEIILKVELKKEVEHPQEILCALQECQATAILVGTQIENTEGTDHKAIRLLEAYCELLYQLSEEIVKENSKEQAILLDQIKAILQEMIAALDEIPAKQQIVFLPYKAAMWDSLESVWKAAHEDPGCDAYVVPIPYYDRNADGSFGKLHYEGDLYPPYVPVTSYEEFFLEEQKPDKIYIHNPYDEYNLVTSVHPDFYSSKLKDYTEELIYIPYFILNEIDLEDEAAIESAAHFCKVPALIHAHKVIVQSEQMKQVYVKVLTEWMGEHTRSDWEKKICGSGSPKIDKILNTKKEDIDIPNAWLNIVQKPDGEWKKIVFYNTSLTTFLDNSESYIDKVRDVLEMFYECREKIALLWRPHPLMLVTVESMRPELREDYIRLVEKYQHEGWGIYDDSADLARAICLADAYYGDLSSVVQLCQKAEVPVMIQNVEMRT